jgi:RNA polymerase sigma-70 factor, ECF subfamily
MMSKADVFETHRRRLTGLAYRMLGSLADAEDVVQETYVRWQGAIEVRDATAFLTAVTTRLSLDALRSARRRRESYVGPWLPEPIVDSAALWDDATETTAKDASVALMLALERLTPLERAVFILHDIFEVGFDEIAATLGRTEAACRQLVVRARSHVKAARPRSSVSPQQALRVTQAFFAASSEGDITALRQLLADDAVLLSDGGRRRFAALNPIRGSAKIGRFYAGIARKAGKTTWWAPCRVNGRPGYVSAFGAGLVQATALDVEAEGVVAIYRMLNPDKLTEAIRLVPVAHRPPGGA